VPIDRFDIAASVNDHGDAHFLHLTDMPRALPGNRQGR